MMKVQGMGILALLFVIVMSLFVRGGEAEAKTFLVNCGANASVNVDGRRWFGDLDPVSNLTVSSGIVASDYTYNGNSVHSPLYRTARIFTDNLNYTFTGIQGNYFLRLHFYTLSFQNHNVNQSSFSVEANGLKLVSEFNVPFEISLKMLYVQSLGSNSSSFSLIKEYFFDVGTDALVIEFTPAKGSFGFVSAIEIVPVVDTLFVDSVNKVGGYGANASLNLNKRGIETMYRLNIGGSEIKPSQDELWRTWGLDSGYMLMADAGSEIRNRSNITYTSGNDTSVAPLLVYESARTMSNTQVLEKRLNMSWKFQVDPDFDYMIRFHFCELEFDTANQRKFRIYINNRTAADNFDVFLRAGGKNKAFHQDYFDALSPKINTLWIQLGPDIAAGAAGTDALMNGLEIFKLSQNENLAYVETYSPTRGNKNSRSLILWVGIGSGIATIAILAALFILIFCFCKRQRDEPGDAKNNPPRWRPLFLVNSTANAKGSILNQNLSGSTVRVDRQFTIAEIKAATNNFDDSLIIGVGGFGKVYKGEIEDGTLVAIKRANPQSEQGLTEFETEIEMLSRVRHRHLVSLIGFCDEQKEMILIYEYMANGTLRGHLFGGNLPPLSWKQRLEVCIGAARGLYYLHTGSDRGIIHRDVKTTNILLDESFVAKMADFGLSKTGPALEHTHVSTAVKGSFGYLDPEYFRRQQLTEKSDVYSLGVVLFEVVCARPVINPSLPKDQINLAEWAMRWQRQRLLETIIDPQLKGKYYPESLKKFGEIAEKCLADEGKSRPTMGEVLWHLEYVLQIHDAWLLANDGENSSSQIMGTLGERESEEVQEDDDLNEKTGLALKLKDSEESDVGETAKSDAAFVGFEDFSQLVNPQGR
ncbi:probable receptor-like protein kinase At1g30570 [Actinidia eriantha]|uniref:probable receptor-like protein kinase At1g30570 n=1 Tax=Actinidia eriantha TaxID=165200 RepID=UPI00258DB4A0|nr:probable receptor-like protein kinase At1g30570 [Actinidia eriantha]